MSKNKSNSPFFAIGQGIDNILDYASISRAGQPTNFLGNAIYKVGEIIAELDFEKFKKPAGLTEQDKLDSETRDFFAEEGKKIPDGLKPKVEMLKSDVDISLKPLKPRPKPTKAVGKATQEIIEETKPIIPTVQSRTTSPTLEPGTEGTEGYKVDLQLGDIAAKQKRDALIQKIAREKDISIEEANDIVLKNEAEARKLKLQQEAGNITVSSSDLMSLGGTPTATSGVAGGSMSLGEAIKAGNPGFAPSSNNRLKPEILEIIEASRYNRTGSDDTPLHRMAYALNSPYLRTDGKSYKYLRELTQPSASAQAASISKSRFFSDFGLGPGSFNIGIENFNRQVKKENYKRQVQNDFDEDLTKEINTLNVDLDKANVDGRQRQDLLDFSLKKKKDLSVAFQDYTNGNMSKQEYELLKTSLNNEVNTLASDLGILKTKAQDYLKNKDNIDLRASDPEMADFYETLIKNPNNIRLKEINGRSYFTGLTNSGKSMKIEVGSLTNGDASFMLTGKADPATYITGALKSMQSYTEEMKTKFGQGVGQLKDDTQRDSNGNIITKSKIREIGENKFLAEFRQDPDIVRSLLSQVRGIDFDGYQTLINQDRNKDGKTDSTEIKQNEEEIMKQLAEEMYDQFVSPQYNPKTETKSRTSTAGGRSGGGGGRGTQGERERFILGQLINQLPEKPTAENFKQFADYLDTNEINYDKNALKEGKLIIGKKGKKMDEIDFTDPGFKTKFSKFATLPAFINPNAYNVQPEDTSGLRNKYNY